jgi:hypothetical protein
MLSGRFGLSRTVIRTYALIKREQKKSYGKFQIF